MNIEIVLVTTEWIIPKHSIRKPINMVANVVLFAGSKSLTYADDFPLLRYIPQADEHARKHKNIRGEKGILTLD